MLPSSYAAELQMELLQNYRYKDVKVTWTGLWVHLIYDAITVKCSALSTDCILP
jgi:hypothetical protein